MGRGHLPHGPGPRDRRCRHRSFYPGVTKFAVGDHVGVGCFVDSCRECEYCLRGQEQYCAQGITGTYNARDKQGDPTYGGYSTHVVVDENYTVRIPDGLALDVAAPLLCAGITLYSPLKHWQAGPGKKVAIVGLGGLGHMGVKIAAALGAEVTVLSQSLRKQDDGLRLGASHYYATSDENTFEKLVAASTWSSRRSRRRSASTRTSTC